jgi:hypothetical protein
MTPPSERIRTFADGQIVLWIAEGDGSLMLKAISPHGDPVELSAAEIQQLCAALLELKKTIE